MEPRQGRLNTELLSADTPQSIEALFSSWKQATSFHHLSVDAPNKLANQKNF